MTTTPPRRPGQDPPCVQDGGVDGALQAPAPGKQGLIADATGQDGLPVLSGRFLPSLGPRALAPWEAPTGPGSEGPSRLDAWVVPPHTQSRRTHGRGRGQKGHAMTQPLVELVEQFCLYQFKQRGRTKGGVEATRWVLTRFVKFVRAQTGRHARVTDLTVDMIQQWMDDMAANDLSLSSLRTRQATLSSLCALAGEAGYLDEQSGCQDGSPATPVGAADASAERHADGCADRRRETAAAPAGHGHLSHPAVLRHAAGIRRDLAGPASR